ncbi:MAG TPA: DoxX family protein [Acidobacteriaceae bacterium]|jgi:putative oxidoreductase|nr:DoxX family protein [Acidobacteriaceae bacterium]
MSTQTRLLRLDAFPRSQDCGLLALRLIVPTSLFIKHGIEKLFTFSAMAQHFPDPLHIGVVPSLIIAMIADGICMPLLVLGLATRWAALWSFCNLFVAWAFVHHFQFAGHGGDHGELIVVYMGVMLTLFLAGPGKYSVDARLS